MAKDYEVTYGRFLNMLSDKFGYTNEVNRGFSGIADLLDSGAILDSEGKPVMARQEKGEANRAQSLHSKLADGKPLYIYFPGEQLPREVKYDEAKGFTVSDGPVQKPEKPEKEPNLFSKAFFQFFRVTGMMTKTYRQWHEYNQKKKAFENLSDRKQIDNRRRNDRILRQSGDAFVKNDREELTESLLAAVEDKLGYKDLMQSKGPEGLHELMAQGLVFNEEGKPIPSMSHTGSPKNDLVNSLGIALEKGKHLYIYQKDTKGKSQPREIYYDWKKGKLVVTDLKELEPVEPDKKAPAQEAQAQQTEQPTESVQQAPPDPKTKSEILIEKLQQAHGGEPLSDQVKENVENIVRNAQMGMEQLKNQVDNEPMIKGGDNVRYILLQNSLEKQVESGKLEPTFMQALNEQSGLEVLRSSADLSPGVKHMTSHKVDSQAFKTLLEGGEKLNSYTEEYHKGLVQLAAKAEEQSGKSMNDLLKGVDPKKAEKIKEQAQKTVKKDDPKKSGPKKNDPKKAGPKKDAKKIESPDANKSKAPAQQGMGAL